MNAAGSAVGSLYFMCSKSRYRLEGLRLRVKEARKDAGELAYHHTRLPTSTEQAGNNFNIGSEITTLNLQILTVVRDPDQALELLP